MTEDNLRLVSVSPAHAIGEWRGHALVDWQLRPSPESARDLAQLMEQLTSLRPGRSCLLVRVGPQAMLPEDAVRGVLVSVGRRVRGSLNCIGVTVEGSGFSAAAVRGVITGLALAVGQSFAMRSHASLVEMNAWVRPRLLAARADFGTDSEVLAAFSGMLAAVRSASAT